MNRQHGNLSNGERTASAIFGVALTALAASRGGPILRILAGVAGTSLIGRAVAGHCAMKAAVTGESTFTQGIKDQWQRTSEVGRQFAQRMANARKREDTGLRAAGDGSETLETTAGLASGGREARERA
jgi:hypothetical protein